MPGDFSRKTFIPQKHYSGVLMQQGRVQLDADWNEQLAIHRHRTETEALDVIGPCGVPQATDGFKIGQTPDSTDLTISPGRIYVDGLLCELEATPVSIVAFVPNNPTQAALRTLIIDGRPFQVGQWVEIWADDKPNRIVLQIIDVDPEQNILTLHDEITDLQNSIAPKLRRVTTYMTQPDYPHPEPLSLLTSPPTSPPSDGTYVVFLNVWQRDVTALDDPHIREVALGGPDTTTRVQNVWQVHLLPVSTEITSPPTSPPSGEVTCHTPFVEWDERTAPSTGMLNARTTIADGPQDPCLLPPSSGYRRLENQLYRVEVHTDGTRDQATFKWSRDNASVETTVEMIAGDKITVADIGKDEVLGFAAAQWVEIVDDESELKASPHPLFQIKNVNPATREIILVQSAEAFENQPHLKLRRWDQTGLAAGTDGIEMVPGWIDLEGGVQVLFAEGRYHPGDYWLIPARTATGEIDWPPFEIPNEQPIPQLPLGIRHHYCRLALLEVQAGALSLMDCRMTFPPLTELTRGPAAEESGIKIERILTIADGALLDNDALVPVSRLRQGIRVICNAPLGAESFGKPLLNPPSNIPSTVPAKPTCYVTLDLPYPLGGDSIFWGQDGVKVFGFQPLILGSEVSILDNMIDWVPGLLANQWLQAFLFQKLTDPAVADRVLAHLTLKGNFIWLRESGQEPKVYLDGEDFGRPRPDSRVDIRFPTGDGRRGGDFEMWFWLSPPLFIVANQVLGSVNPVRIDIVGTVFKGFTERVANATVTLTGPLPSSDTRTTSTDQQGNFVFQSVLVGPHLITAHFGGETAETNITIEPPIL